MRCKILHLDILVRVGMLCICMMYDVDPYRQTETTDIVHFTAKLPS